MKEKETAESGRETAKPSRRDWRFERAARLFGPAGLTKLAGSQVAVFGLGGVGSYAVEGLARSGVGRLTLVDFDRVCSTNINRQLHALDDTVGQSKAGLMAGRVRGINPAVEVRACAEFYDKNTADRLLEPRPDVVVDCIDNVTAKMHLVATCLDRGIPIVVALGSGAKWDPTRIRIVPLTRTHTDPLGRALRKHIRRKHPVTDAQLEGVIAVFSDEPVVEPLAGQGEMDGCLDDGCSGNGEPGHGRRRKRVIYGTAAFVTAAFGMAAASAAIRLLLGREPYSPTVACERCGRAVDPILPVHTRRTRGQA